MLTTSAGITIQFSKSENLRSAKVPAVSPDLFPPAARLPVRIVVGRRRVRIGPRTGRRRRSPYPVALGRHALGVDGIVSRLHGPAGGASIAGADSTAGDQAGAGTECGA